MILVPGRATGSEQKGAEDLALWLHEMTGATFPIVGECPSYRVTGREISIGDTTTSVSGSIALRFGPL